MYWKKLFCEKGWNLVWDLLCSQLLLQLPTSLWAGTSTHPWPLHPSWVTKLVGLMSSTSNHPPCWFPMLPSWFRFSHEILQDLSEMQIPSEILCSECFNGFPAPLWQTLNPLMKLKGLFTSSLLSAPAPHLNLLLHVPVSAFPMCLMVPDAFGSSCLEVFACRCFSPCSEFSAQINSLPPHHGPLK